MLCLFVTDAVSVVNHNVAHSDVRAGGAGGCERAAAALRGDHHTHVPRHRVQSHLLPQRPRPRHARGGRTRGMFIIIFKLLITSQCIPHTAG